MKANDEIYTMAVFSNERVPSAHMMAAWVSLQPSGCFREEKNFSIVLANTDSCHPTHSLSTILRGIFKKFPHFYIFAGNGEGRSSSNWSCLRVSCD